MFNPSMASSDGESVPKAKRGLLEGLGMTARRGMLIGASAGSTQFSPFKTSILGMIATLGLRVDGLVAVAAAAKLRCHLGHGVWSEIVAARFAPMT